MNLIKLNHGQAKKIEGEYTANHICQPYEIDPGLWIVIQLLENIPEIHAKLNLKSKGRFSIGDNSAEDKKFKAWKALRNA